MYESFAGDNWLTHLLPRPVLGQEQAFQGHLGPIGPSSSSFSSASGAISISLHLLTG